MIQPDDFFAALADPTRRRILALLPERGERCVCVLYETLDLPRPKVSRHLGVLRAAGRRQRGGCFAISQRTAMNEASCHRGEPR